MTMLTNEQIIEALKTVVDPEIHADIYTLGLIYDIKAGDDGIDILMTLTTPFCPYGNEIVQNVEKALKKFGVEVRVDLTFEPEWKPSEDMRIALGLSPQDEATLKERSDGK
ncbi:MAG: metal-sulfur cluster assembly factor [bacterium]|nr:metal-sulfur cluster assembly factor [bacterium]